MNVLITGGGRGLGAALAEELARRGARVVVAARTASEVEASAARARAAGRAAGGDAHALVFDVADKGATYAAAACAAALVGDLDVVVHNAATLGPAPLRHLLDTDCEDLGRALEVNVVGPFRLTKAVAGGMIVRGGGLVVHVTSDAAREAYPAWGAYGVSKAALEHLGRVWEAELTGTGVRFLAFDPGEMDTRMHADALPDADRAALADPRDVARRLADAIGAGAA